MYSVAHDDEVATAQAMHDTGFKSVKNFPWTAVTVGFAYWGGWPMERIGPLGGLAKWEENLDQ